MIALAIALAAAAGLEPARLSAVPALAPPTATSPVVGAALQPVLPRRARPAGFAAELADRDAITGPRQWTPLARDLAWARLANAGPENRQAARWDYARGLIGQGRGPEARGVLEVMQADEPALLMVASFRLAVGVALAESGDVRRALRSLGGADTVESGLAANPEACAWRLWALAMIGQPAAALAEAPCAVPALDARPLASRRPFLIAGAAAALAAGRPQPIRAWLAPLSDGDAAANLMRGKAALALGDAVGAGLRFKRAARDGNPQQQVDASISIMEMQFLRTPATPAMLAEIDRLAFVWRGDALERRVLQLSYRVARQRGDIVRALVSGAALLRHFQLGAALEPLLVEVQKLLGDGLAPTSRLTVSEAAGLYWEYRDLAPAGAAGDFLASALADRLQAQGLYGRAAELLRHQLLQRTVDISQGPLSARVAGLFILAGNPADALAAIRATDKNDYPAEMLWERHRMEAVALYKLGRRAEALVVLQNVPDASAIRGEIYWKAQEWRALVAEVQPRLPVAGRLDEVDQAILLRQAIAFAMLGKEASLAAMRTRYLPAFAGLRSGATFDLLTRDVASVDAETIRAAMLVIPGASPVGNIGNLLDAPLVAKKLAAAG